MVDHHTRGLSLIKPAASAGQRREVQPWLGTGWYIYSGFGWASGFGWSFVAGFGWAAADLHSRWSNKAESNTCNGGHKTTFAQRLLRLPCVLQRCLLITQGAFNFMALSRAN